ncbi:hypothetical protein FOCC_FOCC008189 [Frankliniella occidentalis]|nr:hypothetical protein FOCC_FOCC008189 [Frankliniella occidentalis]
MDLTGEIPNEVDRDSEWQDLGEIDKKEEKILRDVGVQVDLLGADKSTSAFISSITSSDQKLFTATGLHSVKLLKSLTICFDRIAIESTHKKFSICTQDRIILAMMKIKLGISFSALSVLFDVTQQTCSNYFYDSVLVLYKILKCMVFWPDKGSVLKNMPKCFSKFKKTRVVLDCYETPIEKAKCISCRVRSYSQYKKNFTAKMSMTVTPSGLICLLCDAFGGRASDKVVTAHSQVYQKCDPLDAIMADKGYPIDEECQDHMLLLYRPPFVRQNKQFTRSEAVFCANVARARVHVERVIQSLREYTILKNKIAWNIVPFVDDIVTIVCALVNLGKPILARDKY